MFLNELYFTNEKYGKFLLLLTKQAQNKTIKTYLRIRQGDKARAQCNTIQALYSSI